MLRGKQNDYLVHVELQCRSVWWSLTILLPGAILCQGCISVLGILSLGEPPQY